MDVEHVEHVGDELTEATVDFLAGDPSAVSFMRCALACRTGRTKSTTPAVSSRACSSIISNSRRRYEGERS